MPLSQTSRHLKKVPPWPLFESPKASDWISSILWWERTLRIDGLSVSFFQDNSKFWGGANLQNAFTELMDSVADQAGNNSCNKDGCAYPPQPSRPRPRPCHNSEPPEYGDSGQVRVPAVTHGCGTGRKERLWELWFLRWGTHAAPKGNKGWIQGSQSKQTWQVCEGLWDPPFKQLYWSRADFQCCANFCWARGLSYTSIYSFSPSFPGLL